MAPEESELTLLVELSTVTTYTDAPSADGTYTYAVASIRSENGQDAESGQSASIEVASDATAPGAPADLLLELTARASRPNGPHRQPRKPLAIPCTGLILPRSLRLRG